MTFRHLLLTTGLLVAAATGIGIAPSAADQPPSGSTGAALSVDEVPSGQRVVGHSVVEPTYDDAHAGVIGFVSTPQQAPLQADGATPSPLYLPVYPAGARVGGLICPHVPVDLCPDHGPAVAGLAAGVVPAVYGAGVLGHDHLMQFTGGPHTVRQPIVVLFTSKAASEEHLLTRAQVEAAVERGDAILVPLPAAAQFHGERVSSAVWALGTPVA